MKHMAIASIAIVNLMIGPAPSLASTEDVFSGPWAGHCGEHVQCTVDFIPIADGKYNMEFKVSSALDDKAVVCSSVIVMKPIAFDVLVTDDAGGTIRAVRLKTTEVILDGLNEQRCQGANINTNYQRFFDQ